MIGSKHGRLGRLTLPHTAPYQLPKGALLARVIFRSHKLHDIGHSLWADKM